MVPYCILIRQSVAVMNSLCGGLHRWIRPYGPIAMLPLLYSPDPRLPNVFQLDRPPMLWTNTEYLADASDNDVNKVGHPALTFVHTSCLEIDANSSQISLTDDDYIQYITVDDDTKDSTEVKCDEATKMGEPTATPKKAKTDKPKGDAKDGGDSHSDDQDDGMFSDCEGQQLSNSTGFQGWSDDEAEGDEPTVVANISEVSGRSARLRRRHGRRWVQVEYCGDCF